MPQGDKKSYSGRQKRMAEHIEESYEKKGVSDDEAERRAWATVNKETGGAAKLGHQKSKTAEHKSRSESAKKGWETRRKKAGKSS